MTREAGGFGVSRVVAQPPTPPLLRVEPPPLMRSHATGR
eukprot:COSAG02_NODE_12279_length_1569_cov_1.646939_2_plen_38_part_01